ncbi:MAG: NADPH:quinone oxidoreductase family protein [Pseudomonadota bacterium]
MRAMIITELGTPLQRMEIDPPRLGEGEALIDVAAVGVNFADSLMAKGRYQERPDPPFPCGMEAAGTVAALGPAGSGALKVGDRVAVVHLGSMVAQLAAPAALCAKIPDGLSFVDAAAMPVAYGTSHLALAKKAALAPGERLLVTGAAGGVGLTAVEIGALMGAEVIAVARGAEKLQIAKEKGATHLIDSETADLKAEVKALGGADVVYDAVGGALGTAAFRAARPGARILPIGFAGGGPSEYPPNILLVKNQSVIGFNWGAHVRERPEDFAQTMAACFAWRAEGRLAPLVSDVMPLEEANAAIELLTTRQAKGKVVLTL